MASLEVSTQWFTSYILITPIDKTKSRGEEKLRISCANTNISVEVWDQGFTLTNPCGHQMSGEAQDSEQTSGNWCHCFSLEYHLGKDGVQSQQGFLDPIFFVQPFSCESAFRIRIKALIQRLLKSMEKLSLSSVSFGSGPKS